MKTYTIDEAKAALKDGALLEGYLNETGREIHAGSMIRCPNHSAHENGDAKPSAQFYRKGDAHIHCFRCNKDWDLIELYRHDNGCSFMDALKDLSAKHGMTLSVHPAGHEFENPDQAYIDKCAAHLRKTDYLVRRGIPYELAERFQVGYDPSARRIIIPYARGYMARTVDDTADVKCLFLPKGTKRGFFNGKALFNTAGDPVFITEGEIDALSIIACGANAIGIGGIQQVEKFVEMASRSKDCCAPLIPFMDRDAAGEAAQAKLEHGLLAAGVRCLAGMQGKLLPDNADGTHDKDANDALVRDPDGFRLRIEQGVREARDLPEPREAPKERPASGLNLRRFSEIPEPTPENEDADALIKNYTLAKGEGIIIAAEPGAGKSTLVTQLALCAAAGKPFFGFEFARPLKVFYLQTELQDRKLHLAMKSQTNAFREKFGWTPEDVDRAIQGVTYDSMMVGNVCKDLTSYILKVFAEFPFDLLIIDPLATFADGDLSMQSEARKFFYEELNALMGGRNYTANGSPVKFGTIVTAHMGKPRRDRNGHAESRHGQFSTAGSYIINAWARFQLNLVKYGKDVYSLIAAKNPECASWKDASGNYSSSIFLKRAERGQRYWTQATKEEVTGAKPKAHDATESRAEPEEKDLTAFCDLLRGKHLSLTEARALAREEFKRALGEKIFEAVKKNPEKYSLSIVREGTKQFFSVQDK